MMLAGRNELLPDPFEEFDPHHKITGKKNFSNHVRALQSKINLEYVDLPINKPTKCRPKV